MLNCFFHFGEYGCQLVNFGSVYQKLNVFVIVFLVKMRQCIVLTDEKVSTVAVFTPSKFPSEGVSNIEHFIHKVVNRATFKPPWTGVKRKLTFYDLKCEFYRYCAPSNGNYRHKQLKRRGETRKSRPQSSFPALAAVIRPHHLLFL